jgi:hypothetical protein
MSYFYDEEAIFQDADIEQAELEAEGRRIAADRKRGICHHTSSIGGDHGREGPLEGGAYYPEQIGLARDHSVCTDICGQTLPTWELYGCDSREEWIDRFGFEE